MVLENLLLHAVIRLPKIARIEGVLDFQSSEVSFKIDGKKTVPKNERPIERNEDSDSEDFTSTCYGEEDQDASIEQEGRRRSWTPPNDWEGCGVRFQVRGRDGDEASEPPQEDTAEI